MSDMKKCTLCQSPANLTCSQCNKTNYCTKNCQKKDWAKHKTNCRNYEVVSNEKFGRYLIAAKDIKQGEIILKEKPILVGPSATSPPLCLKCFKPINRPIYCDVCKVAPICSPFCAGANHPRNECEAFAQNPFISGDNLVKFFQCLMPLRCLILRETDATVWDKFIKMEAHLTLRRDTPIWRNYQHNVEPVLRQFNYLKPEDSEIVQKICGILDVNCFELRVPGLETCFNECVRGVFLEAALMAHDCIGNTHLAVDEQFGMVVHASVPIKKNEGIFFNYTNALQGTSARQSHLTNGKYFKCTCRRCKDPSELGTHMSSIKCVKCQGFVCAKTPLDNPFSHKSLWQCTAQKCNFTYGGSLVKTAVLCAQQLIEETDKTNLKSLEVLVERLMASFTSTHALVLEAKQHLLGAYSEHIRGNPKPDPKLLARKFKLCEELIPILETVEPGLSRLTGITLYEMYFPIVFLANRAFDASEINRNELISRLNAAENVLKKSISILVYEPTGSPEGRLALRAMNELKMLRKNMPTINKK